MADKKKEIKIGMGAGKGRKKQFTASFESALAKYKAKGKNPSPTIGVHKGKSFSDVLSAPLPKTYVNVEDLLPKIPATNSIADALVQDLQATPLKDSIGATLDAMLDYLEANNDLGNYDVPVLEKLTVDDILAIFAYTYDTGNPDTNIFANLNKALQSSDATKIRPWLGVIWHLRAALAKLPDYCSGTSKLVYRGLTAILPNKTDISKVIETSYKKHTLVQWQAYTSTSYDEAVSLKFCGNDSAFIFEIEICNGKNIETVSRFSDEKEILLSPNQKFVVTEEAQTRSGKPPNVRYIKLIQIGGDFTF